MAEPQGALTASIYLRRSKTSDARSVSLAMQEREVRELCARHGAEVVRVFVDDGRSGGNAQAMKRLAWREWLASAAEVDILATWALDRATRSGLIGAAAIIEGITPTGTRFVTVDGLDSATAEFDLLIGIKAAFAKAEWINASNRSKASRREKIHRGEHASGQVPFGCRLDSERRLEADPEESAVVREAAMRIVNGEGVRSVIRWLNTFSRTRRGATWSRTAVVTVLESASTAKHILSGTEREAVVAALHPNPGTKRPGGRPRTWLLSASGTCAGCGRKLTTSRDAKREVTRYACRSTSDGRPCAAPATIRADRVDAHLESEFLEIFGDLPNFVERLVIDGGDRDGAQEALDEAQAALLEDPGAETLLTYQEAQKRAERAASQPIRRQRTITADETVRQVWEAADAAEDPTAKVYLFWQYAHSVTVRKSDGPGGPIDLGRVEIVWGKDVESEPSWDEVGR